MRGIVRLAGAGLIPAMLACGARADDVTTPAGDERGGGAAAGHLGASGRSGAAGHPGAAGATGTAGAAGAPLALTPGGSFELRLSSASTPGAKSKAGASAGAALRVDLTGAAVATVTPRWGSPSKFDVAEKGGALVLSGSAAVRDADATYVWKSFSLELDAARKLTGKLSAAGQHSVYDGGVGESVAVTASGEVTPDATAPDVRLELAPPFTGGARLPWEPVALRFSEPIAPPTLAGRLVAGGADGPVDVAWSLGPAGGAVVATGRLPSFDAVAGGLSVRALAGYADAAGNEGAALEDHVDVLAVPPSASLPGELAAGAVAGMLSWGPSAYSPSVGALALGPLALGSCEVAPAGGAGRATLTNGASKLVVRYRVVAAPKSPGVSPVVGALPAVSVLAATPGAAPVSKELLTPALTEATADGLLASPWVSATVPVQVPAGGELGWAVRAGALTSSGPCGDGANELAPVEVTVLIGSVTSE